MYGGLKGPHLDVFETCWLLSSLTFSAGGYVLVQEKLPSYVVPELTGCQVLKFRSLFFKKKSGAYLGLKTECSIREKRENVETLIACQYIIDGLGSAEGEPWSCCHVTKRSRV